MELWRGRDGQSGHSVLLVVEPEAQPSQRQDILFVRYLYGCSCSSHFLGIPWELRVEGSQGQHEMKQAYSTLLNSTPRALFLCAVTNMPLGPQNNPDHLT